MIFSFLGFSLFSEAFAVRFRAIPLIWVSVSEKDHLVSLTNPLQNVTTIFNITKFPTPTKINTVLLLLLVVVVVVDVVAVVVVVVVVVDAVDVVATALDKSK